MFFICFLLIFCDICCIHLYYAEITESDVERINAALERVRADEG